MRNLLLSFPARLQAIIVTGSTVLMAFLIAVFVSTLFDAHQLKINADLIASVYQVMGTIYAILLTFSLWGVWQLYTQADTAVQKEAFALLDLVHIIEASPRWRQFNIRQTGLEYVQGVVKQEWNLMKNMTTKLINLRENGQSSCMKIVSAIQSIEPEGAREEGIFQEALTLLSNWLDARRTRILISRGNSAKALWPLLIIGAFVLFAFHGLFIAETLGIWVTLLAGVSLVIGITFYLIFTLDCPFAGTPSIDSEPFNLSINLLREKHIIQSVQMPA